MAPLCCHRAIWTDVPTWASGTPFSSGFGSQQQLIRCPQGLVAGRSPSR